MLNAELRRQGSDRNNQFVALAKLVGRENYDGAEGVFGAVLWPIREIDLGIPNFIDTAINNIGFINAHRQSERWLRASPYGSCLKRGHPLVDVDRLSPSRCAMRRSVDADILQDEAQLSRGAGFEQLPYGSDPCFS
jgi:hypothetical protein